MKRILSILCTLALVLSVVLIPGMFSASAANFTVEKISNNVTDNGNGSYTNTNPNSSSYYDGYVYTDFAMEMGKYYNVTFKFDGSNGEKGRGIHIFAVDTAGYDAGVLKEVIYQKTSVGAPRDMGVTFLADDIATAAKNRISFKIAGIGGNATLSDIRINEVPDDEYIDAIYGTNKWQQFVTNGVSTDAFVSNYGDDLMVFDYELNPNFKYKIEYEWLGKNNAPQGYKTAWTAVNAKDSTVAMPSASATKVASPAVSDDARFTAYSIEATGAELGASATNKYLAFAAKNFNGDNGAEAYGYLRKVKVTVLEDGEGGEGGNEGEEPGGETPDNESLKNDGFMHPSYKSDSVKEVVADNIVAYGGESSIANGFMTFDYQLEAGASYIIEMEHRGHRNNATNSILIGATDSKTGTEFKGNTVAFEKGYALNFTKYWTVSHLFNADDVINGNSNYLALALKGDNSCLLRKIKVTKVTVDDGYLHPVCDGEAIHTLDIDGLAHVNTLSYNTGAWMIFDYELEAGASYQFSFEYKGGNYVPGGVLWSATAASTTNTPFDTRFDNADVFSGNKVVVASTESKETFTKYSLMIKADDIIKEGYKYFALVTSSYDTHSAIRNIKLEKFNATGLMPSKHGDELMVSVEDGEVVLGTKVTYGDRAWMKFDYELKPDTEYLFSYDYRGHNWVDNGFNFVIGCVEDPYGTDTPKNIVPTDKRVGGIDVANSQSVFTHKDVVFNSNDVINGNAKYFCLFGAGYPVKWSFKNLRLMERPKQDGGSVLYNGTFDDAVMDEQFWTDKANVAKRVTTENHTTAGTGALHVSGGNFDKVYQGVVVDKNTSYELSFWYKGNLNNNITVGVARDVAEVSRRYLTFYDILEDSNDWKQYKTVINSGDYMVLNLVFGANGDADYYIDDVVLAPTNAAAVYNANKLVSEPYYNYVESVVRYRHWKAAEGKNLVENYDMEGAIPASWGDFVSGSKGTLSIVENEGYVGNNFDKGGKALKFEAVGLNEKVVNYMYFDVEPNTDYIISVSTRTPFWSQENIGDIRWGIANPFDGNMYFSFRENIRGHRAVCNDDEWHRSTFQFNTGDNEKLAFCIEGANSIMYIDELQIFKTADKVDDRPKVVMDSQFNLPTVTDKAPTAIYVTNSKNLAENNTFDNEDVSFWSSVNALSFKGEFEKAGYVMPGEWTGTVDVKDSGTTYGKALHYIVDDSITGKPAATTYIKHFDVEPNTEYTFVVDYLITQKGAGRFAITATNSFMPIVFDKYVDFDSNFNSNLPWQKYAVTFNTNAYEQISFIVQDKGGEAYFDNFALFKKADGSETPVEDTPEVLEGEIESNKYNVVEDTVTGIEDQKLIEGVEEGTTVKAILDTLTNKQNIKVFDVNGEEVTDYSKAVATGTTFRFMDGVSSLDAAVVLINGDVDFNGVVNSDDMRELMAKILMPEAELLNATQIYAGDVDGDGVISIEDLALISMHITGDKALAPITLN